MMHQHSWEAHRALSDGSILRQCRTCREVKMWLEPWEWQRIRVEADEYSRRRRELEGEAA